MENPFSNKALELINKRDRWAMLVAAREWIANFYDPSEAKINISHHAASGVRGAQDAMIVVREYLNPNIPTKAMLLQQINAELDELLNEVKE